MKDFSKEIIVIGLGWRHTDGCTMEYMVNSVEAYLTYMILIHGKE
jgi:hypothetical protein